MPLYAISQAGHTYLEGDFINYSQINTFKMVYDIKNATITRSVDTRYSCYSRSDYKPLNSHPHYLQMVVDYVEAILAIKPMHSHLIKYIHLLPLPRKLLI